MNKKMIWLSAIALSAFFSQASFADSQKNDHCPCMHMQKMQQELNLTADQQEKIKALKAQTMEGMQAKKEQLKSINTQMKEVVKAEKLDEAALDKLIAQKLEIKSAMMKNKIIIKHQMYQLLDANQKTKFNAMKDKWEAKKHEKMEEDDNDSED